MGLYDQWCHHGENLFGIGKRPEVGFPCLACGWHSICLADFFFPLSAFFEPSSSRFWRVVAALLTSDTTRHRAPLWWSGLVNTDHHCTQVSQMHAHLGRCRCKWVSGYVFSDSLYVFSVKNLKKLDRNGMFRTQCTLNKTNFWYSSRRIHGQCNSLLKSPYKVSLVRTRWGCVWDTLLGTYASIYRGSRSELKFGRALPIPTSNTKILHENSEDVMRSIIRNKSFFVWEDVLFTLKSDKKQQRRNSLRCQWGSASVATCWGACMVGSPRSSSGTLKPLIARTHGYKKWTGRHRISAIQ